MMKGRDELGRFLPENTFSKTPPEEMEVLVEEYCKHRALGLDKESFVPANYRTIEKNASDLQAEKIREAEACGWHIWENILRLVTLGQNVTLPDGTAILAANCNPTLLIFTVKSKMRQVYGDKLDAAMKVEEEKLDYSKLSDGALEEITALRSNGGSGGALPT